MPHQITNRKRAYSTRDHARQGQGSTFTWEALNALAYIAGGTVFVVGSVFFLPAFERYAAAGAWLFIGGSALYVGVTLGDLIENIVYYRRHQIRGRKAIWEFATSTVYVTGSLLFIVGSICFLPALGYQEWGAWLFIAGSALFIIGASVNVTQITQAGSLFTLQLLNSTAICFVVGSMLFLVASVPYLWNGVDSLKQTLFSYAGAEFIVGSLLFLFGGLVNAYRAYQVHQQHQGGPRESR